MSARTPDLLDLLAHTDHPMPDVPDGLVLGWRNTLPDLRSRGGFRWAFPGSWTVAPDDGRDLTSDHPREACPSGVLGGLCLARTWTGARSGGFTSAVCLLVAYSPGDVLGSDAHKLRVRRALTLDVVDVAGLARRANLWYANLRDANLGDANLRGANLGGANLEYANLWYANLRDANLGDANLRGANLGGANLEGANLWYANLRGANLGGANLWYANLRGANLEGANLEGADANEFTRPPAGWVVTGGRIVQEAS